MNKLLLLLLLLLTFGCNSNKITDHYPIDLCPSDEGFSCPIDGSPCPFCGRTLMLNR